MPSKQISILEERWKHWHKIRREHRWAQEDRFKYERRRISSEDFGEVEERNGGY